MACYSCSIQCSDQDMQRYHVTMAYKLVIAWQDSAEFYWFMAGGLLGGFVKNKVGDRPM